jgi:hypothetical protein
MARSLSPYTTTMARVYAEQGYLRKAAWMYRHLLEEDPGRPDCRVALEALEKQIAEQNAPSRKELGLMMREWVDLMKRQQKKKSSTSHLKKRILAQNRGGDIL